MKKKLIKELNFKKQEKKKRGTDRQTGRACTVKSNDYLSYGIVKTLLVLKKKKK